MKIGILGSGNIGGNLARLFSASGNDIALANSRGPDSLREEIAAIGASIRATTVADAVAFGAVVVLAVPFRNRTSALGDPDAYAGKIVIDAMNPYTPEFTIEDLGGVPSTTIVAEMLPKARVVKAFNTIYYETLASAGRLDLSRDDRIAIPIAGDDAEAKAVVETLIAQIGFAALDAGTIGTSHILEPNAPLYNRGLPYRELSDIFEANGPSATPA